MQDTLEFPVDIEHDGLRLIVMVIFIVLSIISSGVISAIVSANTINLIALLGGVAVAAGLTYLIEQQLKQRWKSGRKILVGDDEIQLQRRQETATTMTIEDEPFVLKWRFKINKRTRVPKGWYVVATVLEKDDEYIAVYTLMSPEAYKQFDPDTVFSMLQKPDKKVGSDSLRLAGEQRRLHKMESVRWHEGVEMTNEHFMAYVQQVDRVFGR